MALSIYLVLGLILLGVVVAIVWRFSSTRSSLPCPSWLSWLVELDNPLFRNNRAREIIQHLGLQPEMKVLDFGCGPGRLTIPIAAQIGPKGEVTAFDIQAEMLNRNRARAQHANLTNIEFVQGAAGEGKLGHNLYDRALLVTVLGEIPDQLSALKEICESLKEGGILSVTEVIADPHFQGRRKVLRIAASVGFVEKGFFGNSISFTITFEKRGATPKRERE